MGRKIRSVPPDWEHPKDWKGHYKPLFDRPYEPSAQDWAGGPPDKEYYRPAWTEEEATAFQMYETVSEGTPVSPFFRHLTNSKCG